MDQYQSKVTFNDQPLEFNSERATSVLNRIASDASMQIGRLDYNFVSREIIVEINKDHLNHHYSTDIITFDYVEDNLVNGEIFICSEEVRDNAERYDVGFDNELMRVIAHGLLHLVGYKDSTEEEKSLMREMEEKYISIWKEAING